MGMLSIPCVPGNQSTRPHLEELAAQGASAHQEQPLRLQLGLNAAPKYRHLRVMAAALHSTWADA